LLSIGSKASFEDLLDRRVRENRQYRHCFILVLQIVVNKHAGKADTSVVATSLLFLYSIQPHFTAFATVDFTNLLVYFSQMVSTFELFE
jgi:hypothetical protein